MSAASEVSVRGPGPGHTGGWTAEQRALAGIAAIVVVELLEAAVRLRGRAGRAVMLRLYDFDRSSRRGLHRSEVGMFMAGLSGARRHLG